MCNPNLRKDSLQTSTVGLPLSTVLFSLGLCPANFNCLNSDLSAQRTAALFWAVSCSWSILSSTLLFLCLDLSSLPHNLEMSPGRWLGSSWISPHVFPSLSLGVTVFCPWFNTRKSCSLFSIVTMARLVSLYCHIKKYSSETCSVWRGMNS